MIEEAVAGLAYFVFVFFKAFQQRNVAFLHYAPVLPISYAMSFMEVLVISLVAMEASHGWSTDLFWFAATIGTGGGLGAMSSMWLHSRFYK